MIKRKETIETNDIENIGNIQGIIQKENILTPNEMLHKALMFSKIVLPPESSIKEHSHHPEAEIYYLTEGEAVVTDNGVTEVLHEGDVVFTGNGDSHSITNKSNKPVVFLAVILP